jgi:hypothetical protein
MNITCIAFIVMLAVYFACQLSRKGVCAVRADQREKEPSPQDEG